MTTYFNFTAGLALTGLVLLLILFVLALTVSVIAGLKIKQWTPFRNIVLATIGFFFSYSFWIGMVVLIVRLV